MSIKDDSSSNKDTFLGLPLPSLQYGAGRAGGTQSPEKAFPPLKNAFDPKASYNQDEEQGKSFMFLLWLLFYSGKEKISPEEFDKQVEDEVGSYVSENLRERISEARDFFTNPEHTDRDKLTAGDVVDKLTRNLTIPPIVRAQPDPTLAKAIEMAKANPNLHLQKNSSEWGLAEKVAKIINVARRNNLNADMLIAQVRKESGFRNTASSGVAYGIAQFTPATGRQYGLDTMAKLNDPNLALEAMGRHMRDLTNECGGDQTLALAAYNGGRRSIEHLLSKGVKTGAGAILFWRAERAANGDGAFHLWRNQTGKYLEEIAGANYGVDDTLATTRKPSAAQSDKSGAATSAFAQANNAKPEGTQFILGEIKTGQATGAELLKPPLAIS